MGVGTTAAKEQQTALSMGSARCLWWPGCGTSSLNPHPVCDQIHSLCVLEARATARFLCSHSPGISWVPDAARPFISSPQEPGFPTSLFILLHPAIF